MSVKQFAGQMRATIEDIKSKGTAAIFCDNIVAYLQEVEKLPEREPSPIDMEQYKAKLQDWIEANRRKHESDMEIFRSVITAGQNAIKSSFLLNGGAAVALLAFVAHLAEVRPDKVPEFAVCLLPFTLGVLAIAVTSGLTYLTQWLYRRAHPRGRQAGFATNVLCILLGISSYGFFIWGLLKALESFRQYGP